MRVSRKIKVSKTSCVLHATAKSLWTVGEKKSCQKLRFWNLIGVTYTRSCRISTLIDADYTEKAHCSDDKFKLEGQPTFPGDGN